jgi:hypothetical protein
VLASAPERPMMIMPSQMQLRFMNVPGSSLLPPLCTFFTLDVGQGTVPFVNSI